MPDHPVQVRIGQLQQLMQPVGDLDVGIATQAAERRRAFHRAEGKRIELAEHHGAAYVGHFLILGWRTAM